ncbi:ABC transporter ATP-binding protein [Bacillus horti]|uniref:ABC-type multidrug transport system ATPase subunit n=1 Tax=Caldalkalibacillus horti TaxID=77523 RepID=A0ABT9VYQ5_9BACI|nr:ABC transporter ATP-binding protein [Bacillus horti]MDQ0166024.1 ABC-type multidrug transport system ATPase subunit [Bacillus horti]
MKLELNGVGKKYGREHWAIKDITLELQEGVLGLLGENGAGKSTLMRMLATITKPTAGQILWQGRDIGKNPEAIRSQLGYLPQEFGIYPNLSAMEFLEYMAAIKGVHGKDARRRIEELLNTLHLTKHAHKKLGGFSGGMKQRVGIAQALLNDPRVLIVDEPTVGLDPFERSSFRQLLSDLSRERVIIFSTHIVSDVEVTANQIAIISKGTLIHHADQEALVAGIQGKVWIANVSSQRAEELKREYLVSSTVRHEQHLQVKIVAENPPDLEAVAVSPVLEDAYLYYTSMGKGSL